MKALRYAALAVFVFCATLLLLSRWAEAAPDGCEKNPPCDPAQQRPDIFPWSGGNLQLYNPVTVKALAQRTITYRLLTMPGCSTGTVPADMTRVEAEAQKVKFTLVRNDQLYDLTVRINCGSEQIRICGSVNVYCLGRGFPYNPDVEISDIISTYYPDSRLGVLLHEIMGHAVGTWNEQYAACGSSCGFASTPGLYDFMNTSELSRHGFSASEIGRWQRIMYRLDEPCEGPIEASGLYWDSCKQAWVNPGGWFYTPSDKVWHQPDGTPEWGVCDLVNRDCWNIRAQSWVFAGSLLFDPRTGVFSRPPLP